MLFFSFLLLLPLLFQYREYYVITMVMVVKKLLSRIYCFHMWIHSLNSVCCCQAQTQIQNIIGTLAKTIPNGHLQKNSVREKGQRPNICNIYNYQNCQSVKIINLYVYKFIKLS